MRIRIRFITLILAAGAACDTAPTPPVIPHHPSPTYVEYTYAVVAAYPHDTGARTEGLVWADTALIEGTGYENQQSTLRRVRLETGEILQMRTTPRPSFGEGVAIFGDRIYQLTYGIGAAFVYDDSTFDQVDEFAYKGQGWGLTGNDIELIMSNGTDTLYFRDPATFEVKRQVAVKDTAGARVQNLNELECIGGVVYANVYTTDDIVMINPDTGKLVGRIDLTGLVDQLPSAPRDVRPNGIAWIADGGRLLVTGKYWSRIFEIDLVRISP